MEIPDYEILKRCGHGAYGEVWIARNRAGVSVALKTIDKSELIEKELAGLRSYSRITGSPHLIRIFHVGESGETLYYTMELADDLGTGELYIPATLSNLLKLKKRFTPAETTELGLKLLAGLEILHKARLVHRDIKPENILYVNGEPKLSDIGLVRSALQEQSLGGTPGFIPPERLESGAGAGTAADDLYAVGKVLYCCLTGNGVEEYPSFPASLLDEDYCRLNEVILTACNRNAALRFRNTREFREALSSGIGSRNRFRGRAARLYRLLPLLLLPIAAAAGIWYSVFRATPDAPPDREEEPRTLLPPNSELLYPLSQNEAGEFVLLSSNWAGNEKKQLITKRKYAPPYTVHAVCQTNSINIRFLLCDGVNIFNWEWNPKDMRLEIDGITSGKHRVANGEIPVNRWTRFRIEVEPDSLAIYVDGELRHVARGTFKEAPVGLHTYLGGTLRVREFRIETPDEKVKRPSSEN